MLIHYNSKSFSYSTSSSSKQTSSSLIRNEDVYKLLLNIPVGKVSTYGDIARAAGHPNAARTIGRILNKNPDPITVPCHRVVYSNGKIGGYAYGIARKRELLKREGVRLQNNDEYVKDFKKCRVIPF